MAGRPPLGLWSAKLTDPHRISPDPGQCATVFRPINQTRDNETQELTMVKTILVPTDGSKHARSAVSLQQAVDLHGPVSAAQLVLPHARYGELRPSVAAVTSLIRIETSGISVHTSLHSCSKRLAAFTVSPTIV